MVTGKASQWAVKRQRSQPRLDNELAFPAVAEPT
jgi:hypothetical protein